MDCVIFDIDGTLANIEHRLNLIQREDKDWDTFWKEGKKDKPFDDIIWLANIIADEVPIILVTGRNDVSRKDTEEWLLSFGVPYTELHMRKDNDYRDDDIIKSDILDHLLEKGWNPIMVFDDRDRVVKMWRDRGLRCLQVAGGNF